MSEKRLKIQALKQKLLSKRRFIIYNEETLAESFSLKLTLMNVFVVGSLGAILIIIVTTFLIAFTPLREYIPGYASTQLRQQAAKLSIQTDSLLKVTKRNNIYIQTIQGVLNGKVEYAKLNKDSIQIAPALDQEIDISATDKELELRKNLALENEKNVFLTPVLGKVKQKFNPGNKYFGVNIATNETQEVKAVASGTIISVEEINDKFTIIILHDEGFISVYSNVSSAEKQISKTVLANQSIGNIVPDGKKLFQFQLWQNNKPINPEKYINFQ